jgi:hypothetical protein
MSGTRKRYSAAFEARVALEAAKQTGTLAELSKERLVRNTYTISRPEGSERGDSPGGPEAGLPAFPRNRRPGGPAAPPESPPASRESRPWACSRARPVALGRTTNGARGLGVS